jgi:threonylcarbamoyladenosine tRNA methylthiotransferase MtaB
VAEYHVENFGCRASQADGAAISLHLEKLGLSEAGNLGTASVLVLNTCSVTQEADRQARAYVRKARRANPNVKVLVTGCYAQRAPEEVAALPGVDRVVGNSHKGLVARMAAAMAGMPDSPPSATDTPQIVSLQSLLSAGRPLADDTFAHSELALAVPGSSSESSHYTRPNLKVQDGCGNRCSFCVIPQTRGGSRSVQPAEILESVHAFSAGGGQEIVLSGINLGRWGRDIQTDSVTHGPSTIPKQPTRLEELVEAILLQTNLPRLRISSVEPMDWSDRLLDLFQSFGRGQHPRLARHAHLPLQSGSDAILRAMYRRYRPWHYAEKVQAIRLTMPHAAIGADVMVGFPGETDTHFQETLRFIESLPFTYLHLFPFSARPGTPAWALQQQKPVAGEAVLERMATLRSLADAKHRDFREQQVGQQLSVVTLQESRPQSRQTRAISDNFLTVDVAGTWPANRMFSVSAEGLAGAGLRASRAKS